MLTISEAEAYSNTQTLFPRLFIWKMSVYIAVAVTMANWLYSEIARESQKFALTWLSLTGATFVSRLCASLSNINQVLAKATRPFSHDG